MPGLEVSARLTVFYDGQFWVGLYERDDHESLAVARHVFGPEPSLPEILELVAGREWFALDFVPTSAESEPRPAVSLNPKRAQREAARALRSTRSATRAQEAKRLALEERAEESENVRREERDADAELRRAQHVAKQKAKRRGH